MQAIINDLEYYIEYFKVVLIYKGLVFAYFDEDFGGCWDNLKQNDWLKTIDHCFEVKVVHVLRIKKNDFEEVIKNNHSHKICFQIGIFAQMIHYHVNVGRRSDVIADIYFDSLCNGIGYCIYDKHRCLL